MAFQVLHTKVTRPLRREDLLSRKRLLDLIDDLLDHKLVLVSAPAGYGKTSLLLDAAYNTELPFCWFTLDVLDQDFQRFAIHFIAALAERFPDFGKRSTGALQALAQENLSLERFVTFICNEIYHSIREHFVIILDDYHVLGDESHTVNAFVNRFIQCVDENCHIVLLSRSLPTLADLPLLVARSQVGGIGLNELAFTANEIQTLMKQNYNQNIPRDAAQKMAQETEGWITGLLLSAQTMWQGMTDRLMTARVSGVGLYDYLAHQVLDQQPPELRDFLLRTSHFDELNVKLCEDVLGLLPDGYSYQDLFARVVRDNLFVLPVDKDGIWLRYHHLFQEFLQNQLSRENPEERSRILHRIAELSAERGGWEKAYHLYKRLNDIDSIADLLEEAGESMIRECRLVRLAQWLDALPPEVLSSRPALLARRGIVAASLGETDRGLHLLDRAVTALRAENNKPRLSGALLWRAHAHHIQGNYPNAIKDTDEVLALAREQGCSDRFQAEAHRIRGMSFRTMGRLNEALENLSTSHRMYRDRGDRQSMAKLSLNLGIAHLDAGEFGRALDCYQEALDYYRGEENIFVLPAVLNDLAYLHYLLGEYEKAAAIFEEALTLARQSGNIRIEGMVLIGLGDVYTDLEAYRSAGEIYRDVQDIVQSVNDRYLILYLALARCALARLSGDLLGAHNKLQAAEQLFQPGKDDYMQALYLAEAGRFTHASGQTNYAANLLESAVRIFVTGGQRIDAVRSYLSLASAVFDAGDIDTAIAHLKAAFDLASALNNQHILIRAAREAKPLLHAVKAAPEIGNLVVQLIDQVAQYEAEIPKLRRRLCSQQTTVEQTPPKLIIQALGRVQVSLDDKIITSSDWQTYKARDLFFLLLSASEGMTKEALGEILWPESSPAQLKLRFKNTLYRLRRAIEPDVIVYDGDIYSFNRQIDYEYDVETFRLMLSQAEKAIDPGEKKRAYEQALQVFQGEYLSDVGGTWVFAERKSLQRAYINASLELAQLYLEAGMFKPALMHCDRLLSAEPCLEEAHRLSMQVYASQGDRSAIIYQYEFLQRLLQNELGVAPSQKTETLYNQLIH